MDIRLLRQAKILIVDDEADNIALLKQVLRQDEYSNIYSTTEPLKVTRLVQELDPDLILLDLHMPDLDGFGVMQQVQQLSESEALVLQPQLGHEY